MPALAKARSRPRKAAPRRQSANGAEKVAGIGSAAVKKATGSSWEEWVAILDRDGAAKLPHAEIARLVSRKHGVGDWWSQMVTVGYEQARGLRVRHQTARGFQVSGSKTINAPVSGVYKVWQVAKLRERWLPTADLEVRKATVNKSLRITWDASGAEGHTNVEVNFYSKGEGKSQVTVQHSKLRTAAAGKKMKEFWRERLDRLKEVLES